MEYEGHRDQKFGHITFAQHGDDLMLVNLFNLMGIEKPSYLDLGAHHPFIISNTALMYSRGSRGVNVEANPNLIAAFKTHRPEDVNVLSGVGLTHGVRTFFMYSDSSGRNTFSPEEVKTLDGVMKVQKTLNLPVRTVNDIVDEFCPKGWWPDLLTLDIEGYDYDILKSADFSKSKPKIICVEVRRHKTRDFATLMFHHNFDLLCRMGENLIFVNRDYWEKIF